MGVKGADSLTANPDKSFVTAVCDLGVASPPIFVIFFIFSAVAAWCLGSWFPGFPGLPGSGPWQVSLGIAIRADNFLVKLNRKTTGQPLSYCRFTKLGHQVSNSMY